MKVLSINQHEALGDHVICNGLNREIFKKSKEEGYDKIIVWTREWLVPSISFMYRDVEEVEVLNMDSRDNQNKYEVSKRVQIHTMGYVVGIPGQINWDQTFYNSQNIPFETRWTSFFCKRNLEREEDLYRKLNPSGERYTISQDTHGLINYSKIRNDINHIKIYQGITENAFDYLTLLDRAEEIHCCDSGFKHIVESFPEIGKSLFYHNNPPRNINHYHTSKKNWKEI